MGEREMLFNEILLPQQQSLHGTKFPTILTPNNPKITPCLFTDAIKSHKTWLESTLHRSGAILLRGFPVSSPSDFNNVVEAFNFPEFFYVGGRAPRIPVIGRVFTANDTRPDIKISFHHEMAYLPVFPSKLFFFCEEEPECGGETPIVLSHIVYERMKERHPEFVSQLEDLKVLYTHVMSEKDNHSLAGGKGWQSAFRTNDKRLAEERAAKQGSRLEWMNMDNAVKVIMGPIPAIRFDKTTQQKLWFNTMAVSYDTMQNDKNVSVTFGDGKPFPANVMSDLNKILNEECVVIPWKKGDVMLLDNLTVLHSRSPLIKPPRRVLASLCQ